ncbi:MAG: hypothetical protein JXQ27_04970 [Acidobacteria bacterium]|nr:hypothetical protein [Acidobacteriota bacterium]
MENLSAAELIQLIRSVFPARDEDRRLAILADVPRAADADNEDWRRRRRIAGDWLVALAPRAADLGLEEVVLVAYPDVGSNNADLPEDGFRLPVHTPVPDAAAELDGVGDRVPFADIFAGTQLFLAPTEYSTTAPLKNAARQYGFRAATMPGFSPRMLPALRIDYTEVNRRVQLLKERLDRAQWADVHFLVDDRDEHRLFFDLRWRSAHASSGRFPDQGVAGNLPSGETYIVPYEGERDEEPSRTCGTLPVQIGAELVVFTIEENRAVAVTGEGETLRRERAHLLREPAYGNMAEVGFGILGDFGLEPIGEILLDEKLGFHIAFGRSDHFGGMVGPGDFSSPQAVIHLDQIYIPATQPRVLVTAIELGYEDESGEIILEDGEYLVF